MTTIRDRRPWPKWATVLFLSASGCTYGTVGDAVTEELLGGAEIEFRVVAPASSPPTGHVLPQVELGEPFRARTWSLTDPGANGYEGIYYLNPFAADGETDPGARAVRGGWNAVSVTRAGYDPRRFYRNHIYTPCTASATNPFSAGPYPLDVGESDPGVEGLCKQQDFMLHRTGTSYDKAPDLIVDPRSLLDRAPEACGLFGDHQCVRVFSSTPNVGDGDLLLVAPWTLIPDEESIAAAEPVSQLISRAGGGVTEVDLGGYFLLDRESASHRYIPAEEPWVRLRLRRVDPDLCPDEASAGACPVERQNERSLGFCLYDTAVFDAQYTPERSFSGCPLLSRFPHESRLFHREGIGAGRATAHVAGYTVDITGLPAGDYWLEAEVNAGREVVESDYDNNIARVQIAL